MKSFARENQPDIIQAFNSTSRFYVDQMVDRIYPTELQLNKADTEVPFFLDLNLCISDSIVSNKIYDKRDFFRF